MEVLKKSLFKNIEIEKNEQSQVSDILDDIKNHKDEGVKKYNLLFDKNPRNNFRVMRDEIVKAYKQVDIKFIEDLKVAISEACTNAIKHSLDDRFIIIFNILENGLTIEIIDEGQGYDISSVSQPSLDNLQESGMGLFIIQSLMDDVTIESQEGKGTRIRMTKYLGVDI